MDMHLVKVGYNSEIAFRTADEAAAFVRAALRGKKVGVSQMNGKSAYYPEEGKIELQINQIDVMESQEAAHKSVAMNLTFWVNKVRLTSERTSMAVADIKKLANVPEDHDLFLKNGEKDMKLIDASKTYSSTEIKEGFEFVSFPKNA